WAETMFTSDSFAPPILWQEWLEILLLHREAKILIEGTPPPEDARLLVVRGRALAAVNWNEEASPCYARALQLGPYDIWLRLKLSQSIRRTFEAGARHWVQLGKIPDEQPGPSGEYSDPAHALAAKQFLGQAIVLLLLKDDLPGYCKVCK